MNIKRSPFCMKRISWKKAFKAMIRPEVMKNYRESFFERIQDRLRIVTLKKDTVMPTQGVVEALGPKCVDTILEELDFPTEYILIKIHFPPTREPHLKCFINLLPEYLIR